MMNTACAVRKITAPSTTWFQLSSSVCVVAALCHVCFVSRCAVCSKPGVFPCSCVTQYPSKLYLKPYLNLRNKNLTVFSYTACQVVHSLMDGDVLELFPVLFFINNWLLGDWADGVWGVEDHLHRLSWPSAKSRAGMGQRGRNSDRADLHHCGWNRRPCAARGMQL